MKITKRQLRRIIRSEKRKLIAESFSPMRSRANHAIRRIAKGGTLYETNQQRSASDVMRDAGLSQSEMSKVIRWIDNDDHYEFYDSPAFEKLFELLAFSSGIMPYGIAKGRTGEPDVWILEYLANLS